MAKPSSHHGQKLPQLRCANKRAMQSVQNREHIMSTPAKSPYILRPADVAPYSPANHSGTNNHRLVAPRVNGARFMEVIYGDLERGGGAAPHAHPGMEQATYIIEGEGTLTVDGTVHKISAGDLLFFPPAVFHEVHVTSSRLKLLVIYSPPYGEDPAKVITKPTA
jgi:quercetin dioxygenase-like cupin family protein